ncbi:MAG TPA: dihydropteroate synthase [Caulobacteraceae bacterium]|nr:dihydropteroate synthase [Caulobacteraceae bacterium]
MGVVNVTPDSFSDGGRFASEAAAVAHGLSLIEQGADILDIGGESTRPGAEPVGEAEELARVVPVIAALRARWDGPISIDTLKPAVARAAIDAGATIWNDVSALRSEGALRTTAELGCGVVLMHMQGEPRTMQADPRYDDVVEEVRAFLAERADAAMAAGVARERIWLDPGIGFGKRLEHNLALVRHLDRIADLGLPVVLGVSRKRFVQAIDPAAEAATDRLGGSLAAALHGLALGAAVLRVHDVRETAQAVKVWRALQG